MGAADKKHISALAVLHHKITAATLSIANRSNSLSGVNVGNGMSVKQGFAKNQHSGSELLMFVSLVGLSSPVSCSDHCDKSSCTVSLKLRFKCV